MIRRVARQVGTLVSAARALGPAARRSAYITAVGRDMGNYFGQVDDMCVPLTNPFCYYAALVGGLQSIPSINLTTVADFATCQDGGRLHVCLRHDVDADPLTALRAARHLARVGVSGSFYLLHTSPYYADLVEGVVVRNPELVHWIRGFIVAGCEIGLHNDALSVEARWGLSGIAALRDELAWLRAQGAIIRGTVAHNSGPVYGAENYEIFSGRKLWRRKVVSHNGRRLPLGKVSEAGLGLFYEGTFAKPKVKPDKKAAQAFFSDLASADIRSEKWMKTYLLHNPACDWRVDVQCWLLGKDMWVVAGRCGDSEVFAWNIGLADLLTMVKGLPLGTKAMMVVHPEYVRG
jgi:hypothetical protein